MPPCADRRLKPAAQLFILLAGLIAGQFLIYGPSLTGQKVLLPLDILNQPGFYIPSSPTSPNRDAHDPKLIDLVVQFEPDRQFAVSELRAGRFPLWNPHQYGGVPFIWPKYSPLNLLSCITPSPFILAWVQLAAALIAGFGMFAFCTFALRVSFWPATLASWCYPLTGFFVLWQGYPTCAAVYWLPWLLLVIYRTARSTSPFAPPSIAATTALVLVSGHIDVAAQVLIISALYAAWCIWDVHHSPNRTIRNAAIAIAAGWAIGLLIASPHFLPILDYAKAGYRVALRAEGLEERPPIGLSAIPHVVLPDIYGSTEHGSILLPDAGPANLQESAAAAYSGLIATFLLAPLAWFSRQHRSSNIFWSSIAVLGLAWCINLQPFVALLRLPGLNMMSHNRLVFATAFAILTMSAIGLDALKHSMVQWRRGLWIPLACVATLFAWCAWRSLSPPEPIAHQLEHSVRTGQPVQGITSLDDLRAVQTNFIKNTIISSAWCAATVALCLSLRSRRLHNKLFITAGFIIVADLLFFAHGRRPQCNPDLYFPHIPALQSVRSSGLERSIGYGCLPAKFGQAIGLRDPRGYDSVDPAPWTELLLAAADPRSPSFRYAMTYWLVPTVAVNAPDLIRLHPILNMINVRHVIFRGAPPPAVTPTFQSADYWVLENRHALPRLFVPAEVFFVPHKTARLAMLSNPAFNPAAAACVEIPIPPLKDCRGTARVIDEIPTRIIVDAQMQTAGLLVMGDMWEKGWLAFVNNKPTSIVRVNHTLRGVILPPGPARIEFRYESPTVKTSFILAAIGTLMLLAWLSASLYRSRTHPCQAS